MQVINKVLIDNIHLQCHNGVSLKNRHVASMA